MPTAHDAAQIFNSLPVYLQVALTVALSVALLTTPVVRLFREYQAVKKLEAVEQKVFQPTTGDARRRRDRGDSEPGPSPLQLFNLYSAQIDRYHTVTRSRAGWSFFAAIGSSVAGLGLIFWGAVHLLDKSGWENVAKGSVISAMGGAVGAYITKTFLDVYRLSLLQLNRYSHQPVLNAHILTAQRLANQLGDETLRQRSYQEIIDRITNLITDEQDSYDTLLPSAGHLSRKAQGQAASGTNDTPRGLAGKHQVARTAPDNSGGGGG